MSLYSLSVAVVIPCYRCSHTLGRAINSIEKQTITPRKIFVIDDGNKQEEKARIIRICRDSNLYEKIEIIHLGKQSGPGAARNAGWEKAEEEYIAFLDADDAWQSQKLEIQCQWMENNPNVSLSGHTVIEVDSVAPEIKLAPDSFKTNRVKPIELLLRNRFSTPAVMLRRNIEPRFSAQKNYSEDYLLWLEVVLGGKKAAFLNLPLAFVFKPFFGSSGQSGNLLQMEKGEICTYFELYRKEYLSFLKLYCLIPISIIKFLRRFWLTKTRFIPK